MSKDQASTAPQRGKSFAHVAEASWGKGLSTLLRITRMTLRHPWQVAITIVSTFIAATLQLFIPRLLGQAIDQAQGVMQAGAGAAAEHALWTTALILLVVSVLRGLFTMAQNFYGEIVGHQTGYELRLAFYEKIQRLSFSFHDKVHTGDLITLGLLDLDGVRMFFSTGLVRVVLLGVLIGVGAYLLLSTDLVLGLLSLSFVPFVAWRSSVTQLALRSTWLTLQERLSVLSRVMDENLGGIRVVRAFAAQRHELEKFDRAKQDALDLANQRVDIRVSNTSAMNFSFFAAMGLVLWFGGEKVIAGEISVGTLAQFLTFMTILQMPVRQLGLMVNSFARASTCGTRLFELLDLEIDIKDAPGRQGPGRHRRRAALRQCRLPLRGRRRAPDAVGHLVRGEARRDRRHRRPAGQRQVDHRAPDPALLRRRLGRDHHRRPGHPQGDAADRCARRWAWCSRIRSCSRPRSRTTSPTATRGRASSASSAPPNSRSCTTTSSGFRPATRPSSANAAHRFPAASGSACRLPAA